MERSAEAGFQGIELAYLRPEAFDLAALAQRAERLGLAITVTMGLPLAADVSSTDRESVARGEALLARAVAGVRDIGGIRLGGILYSAHTKYNALPSAEGRRDRRRLGRRDRQPLRDQSPQHHGAGLGLPR